MPDLRILKLAKVLIHYSLEIKPDQQVMIYTAPLAQELCLACYEEALRAGANVSIHSYVPGSQEIYYKIANDAQLDYISPINKLVNETFDAVLNLEAENNTRELSGVDPSRIARNRKARMPLAKIFFDRTARKELRWCVTAFPTDAMAQEADMSLAEYQEFVYAAGRLNEENPVAIWRKQGDYQRILIEWLKSHDRVSINGANIDMTLSIKERIFENADGKYNFPDGEIFTGPVENSANGWVRFRYPAIYDGQEVTDIELRFKDGRVVDEKAGKGQDLLTKLLNTDNGSRYLGEWGIGTNDGIRRFTKNMLFDEKMAGTIHFAVGASYPETGGKNESGLHWDMLCDMSESEILIDNELFYQNGRSLIIE